MSTTFSNLYVALFIFSFTVFATACEDTAKDDADCQDILALPADAMTFNQKGIGNGCPHALEGMQVIVGMPFYATTDPTRRFEWKVPTGYTDRDGKAIPSDYTSTEATITVFPSTTSPRESAFQLRVVNDCEQSSWVTSSMKIYETSSPELTNLPDLPEGRGSSAVFMHEGRLHVLYGANYDDALQYRYVNYRHEPTTDTWTLLPAPAGAVPGVGLNTQSFVKRGNLVYMIDHQLWIYVHDLAANTLTKLYRLPDDPGFATEQGTQIFANGDQILFGPVRGKIYEYDPAQNAVVGSTLYPGFDYVNVIISQWTDGNKRYFFRQRNSAVEYNMSLGTWREIPMREDFVGRAFRVGEKVYVQTNEIPEGRALVREWNLQSGALTSTIPSNLPACLNGAGGLPSGPFYMSATLVDGKSVYFVGGGNRHDSNEKAGFGSSKSVFRLDF